MDIVLADISGCSLLLSFRSGDGSVEVWNGRSHQHPWLVKVYWRENEFDISVIGGYEFCRSIRDCNSDPEKIKEAVWLVFTKQLSGLRREFFDYISLLRSRATETGRDNVRCVIKEALGLR